MATTLAQLRADVVEEIKKDPNNRVSSATLIDKNINRALKKVQQDLNFSIPEAIKVDTITTSANEVALASDFQKVANPNSVKISDSTRIFPVQYTELIGTRNMNDTGQPYQYYIRYDGTQYVIGFYPRPTSSQTVTLPYYAVLPELTDAVDSPLPSQYDIAIVEYATYLTLRRLPGSEAKAADYLAFYKDDIQDIAANNMIKDAGAINFGMERVTEQFMYNPRGESGYYGN